MHVRQRLALVTALVLGAALLTPAPPGSAATPTTPAQRTLSQIEALSTAKLARTATQRKVDSRLLAEIAMRSGAPVAAGIKNVHTGVDVSKGEVTVDLHGGLTPGVLNGVRAGGGRVATASSKLARRGSPCLSTRCSRRRRCHRSPASRRRPVP